MSDAIFLEGMVFYGYHGNHQEEQTLGQRFVVDVEVLTDLGQVAQTDQLEDAIDLGAVYRSVKEMVEGPPVRLVETLAARLAQDLLARFPCDGVTVRVKKPNVPIPGPLDYEGAEVTITR